MNILGSSKTRWVVALTIPVMVGLVAIVVTRPASGPGGTTGSSIQRPGQPDPVRSKEINTVLDPDDIPALDEPAFMIPSKAGFVPARAQVMGVSFGGQSHAYLVSALSRHEIVNDRVGGRNIAVTW